MGRGGVGGCRWEWGVVAANFPLSCSGRAVSRQLGNFGGPCGMGRGGVGGCRWEWGVDGDNFWLSCSADGPCLDNWSILEVPVGWGGEGLGDACGSGEWLSRTFD